jgi:heat shock protein HspQ
MSDQQQPRQPLGTTPPSGRAPAPAARTAVPGVAKYRIGQIVKHRFYPFRGVVYDVDPVFNHTEEWYNAIPSEMRPRKDQPFYHLYAENERGPYEAYVSEQNLLPDADGGPIRHPMVTQMFADGIADGGYRPKPHTRQRLFN